MPRTRSMASLKNSDLHSSSSFKKKYHINWEVWFKEYILESAEDSNTSANLPYRLLISRILVGSKWVKKDSVKARADFVKPTKIYVESATLLLQDTNELKTRIVDVECGLETLQDVVEKVFGLQKNTRTDVGKSRIIILPTPAFPNMWNAPRIPSMGRQKKLCVALWLKGTCLALNPHDWNSTEDGRIRGYCPDGAIILSNLDMAFLFVSAIKRYISGHWHDSIPLVTVHLKSVRCNKDEVLSLGNKTGSE
ncbi:hypothetical protein H5410_015903 [Solanum commersonii]|uniref:Uncharacterized protein n=1 Tax=Solanum commersonii TaxID=4109 RepID=A0A9J5ZVY4_SOLCO|nr:hypothetical protein H5410_015903 [Solanum commersonii]